MFNVQRRRLQRTIITAMILLAIDLFPAAWSAFFAGLLTGMLILFFTLLRK